MKVRRLRFSDPFWRALRSVATQRRPSQWTCSATATRRAERSGEETSRSASDAAESELRSCRRRTGGGTFLPATPPPCGRSGSPAAWPGFRWSGTINGARAFSALWY